MASALKRKRASVEGSGIPKRAKSIRSKSDNVLGSLEDGAGWEAAISPPTSTNGFKETNGTHDPPNGSDSVPDLFEKSTSINAAKKKKVKTARKSDTGLASPKAMDFEQFEDQRKALERRANTLGGNGLPTTNGLAKIPGPRGEPDATPWVLSEPVGGRMLKLDPVFSADERFLITATSTTLHVYSTENSLLVRSIKLQLDENEDITSPLRIVAYSLSPAENDIAWVACSDGSVFRVDWTSGTGADQSWKVSSTGCINMTVASILSAQRERDVVFTTERRSQGGFRITANELAPPNGSIKTAAKTIYRSERPICIHLLKTSKDGSILVGASGNTILLGHLTSKKFNTISNINYEFLEFDHSENISSIDLRVQERAVAGKSSGQNTAVVDIVVGTVSGIMFVYSDLLARLRAVQHAGAVSVKTITPRKLHWHHAAVNSVKWSLDGNYLISGGREGVLVLWQVETQKQQFLPHLTSTIESVVVSPNGSSYGVQLADNSVMVISTAELIPTANISGIQANIIEGDLARSVDNIERKTGPRWPRAVFPRVPAVINPANPSQLLLSVGERQEVKDSDSKTIITTNPFLQTFNLSSFRNVTRQPLARTNITNVISGPYSYRITDPRITHMKISGDGNWLATVDEWTPHAEDFEHLSIPGQPTAAEQRRRTEVYLKFWQWSKTDQTWELISRINSPHPIGITSAEPGKILDLAVDPTSLRFSTIGEDGAARIWVSKTRKRDGVVVRAQDGTVLRTWHCQHAISLIQPDSDQSKQSRPLPQSGSVAFSEDGSVLAASIDSAERLLHLVDTASGSIRTAHAGLYEGKLIRLEFLGKNLIALSKKLVVFDVVTEEPTFGMAIPSEVTTNTQQRQEMMHLAVDLKSETFAITLPILEKNGNGALKGARSDVLVFQIDNPEPILVQKLPTLISALIPAVSSEGYLIIDSDAHIRSICKKGTQSITDLAQSTSALQLDTIPDTEPVPTLSSLVEDLEELEDEDEQLPTPAPTADGNEDHDEEGGDVPVVPKEQLSEIFDVGPAFTLPTMEEMFYQVTGLFAHKPLAVRNVV